eukprot:474921_1
MVNHFLASNPQIRKYGNLPQSTDFFVWIWLFQQKKMFQFEKKLYWHQFVSMERKLKISICECAKLLTKNDLLRKIIMEVMEMNIMKTITLMEKSSYTGVYDQSKYGRSR